jgi:hypothetical protein
MDRFGSVQVSRTLFDFNPWFSFVLRVYIHCKTVSFVYEPGKKSRGEDRDKGSFFSADL